MLYNGIEIVVKEEGFKEYSAYLYSAGTTRAIHVLDGFKSEKKAKEAAINFINSYIYKVWISVKTIGLYSISMSLHFKDGLWHWGYRVGGRILVINTGYSTYDCAIESAIRTVENHQNGFGF